MGERSITRGSIRKTIRAGEKDLNHTVLIELFTPHLSEKISRFYHLPKPRYTRHKKLYDITDTLCSKKSVIVFLIRFLHFKLHLMFQINTSKGAAYSELSRYV
jgi:hypothetical protein